MCVLMFILSIIFYDLWAVLLRAYPYFFLYFENNSASSYQHHHQSGNINHWSLFRVGSWNNATPLRLAIPDSKVYGANMGPTWGQRDPGGPHVGPMNFAIWDVRRTGFEYKCQLKRLYASRKTCYLKIEFIQVLCTILSFHVGLMILVIPQYVDTSW